MVCSLVPPMARVLFPSVLRFPAVPIFSLHHKLSLPLVNLRRGLLLPGVRPSQHSRGKPWWMSIKAGLFLKMASTFQFLGMSHRHGGPVLPSVPAPRYLRPSKLAVRNISNSSSNSNRWLRSHPQAFSSIMGICPTCRRVAPSLLPTTRKSFTTFSRW